MSEIYGKMINFVAKKIIDMKERNIAEFLIACGQI